MQISTKNYVLLSVGSAFKTRENCDLIPSTKSARKNLKFKK